MNRRTIFSSMAALLVLHLVGLGTAQAGVITGNLWIVSEAVSQNAIAANVPGGTPDVTFEVNTPVNFFGDNVTRGTWLSNGSAFNIVENTAGTLASFMDNGTNGTLLNFTGLVTVTNGQTFTVTHDDGLTLIIGGLDLGFSPLPTAPAMSTETYTGPSGTFPFQLVYGECCGGPAVLQIDLPFQPAPEPGTLVLVAGGLLVGTIRRRIR
jgi:hypothetical protein